ncbi:NADH-quinone oxidoreductase subunit B family protein [Thermovibrio sp.]
MFFKDKILQEEDLKLKIGFFHLSSCSGCQVAFLDMFEKIVEFLDTVELVYSNMLTKKREIPSLDVAFIEGALCPEESSHLRLIKEINEKAKLIVSVGACASFGGIRRLSCGNQMPQPQHASFIPLTEIELIRNKLKYAIPGCPPNPSLLENFLLALLELDYDFLQPFEFITSSSNASGFNLISEVVNKGFCVGCGTCETACPTRAISFAENCGKPGFTPSNCVYCGSCLAACPQSFKPYPQPTY